MARAKKETVPVEEYTCVLCGSDLKKEHVYKPRNRLLDSHLTLCKNCACREANAGVDGVHDVLMLLDIPFIPEIYKECCKSENVFSAYMLRINNPKKNYNGSRIIDLHYIDSPTLNAVKDVNKYINATDESLEEYRELFGDWWEDDKLIMMNSKLDKHFVQFGGSRDDLATLSLYCELIRLEALSMLKYSQGDYKTGKDLSETRQKMLSNNKMNVSSINEKKENDSFGVKIDWAEYKPIMPSKKYFDIDGIQFMWKMMIEQLLRFVGVNKTPVEKDALEMIDYVEKHPEYNRDME